MDVTFQQAVPYVFFFSFLTALGAFLRVRTRIPYTQTTIADIVLQLPHSSLMMCEQLPNYISRTKIGSTRKMHSAIPTRRYFET
uniref:Putative secreted protein n=1 Tax=Ixodes ricinus TaxID=34613 RepID=A0A6B0TXJ1_IXORI